MINGIKQVSKKVTDRMKRFFNVELWEWANRLSKKAVELDCQFLEFTTTDWSTWVWYSPKMTQVMTKIRDANLAKQKWNDETSEQNAS